MLKSIKPKSAMGNNKAGTIIDNESNRPLHLVTKSQFLRKSRKDEVVYALITLGELPSAPVEIPSEVRQIISGFNDIMPTYVAPTLLSWSRVMFESYLTHMSDTRIMCVFKNSSRVHMMGPFECCRVRAT